MSKVKFPIKLWALIDDEGIVWLYKSRGAARAAKSASDLLKKVIVREDK